MQHLHYLVAAALLAASPVWAHGDQAAPHAPLRQEQEDWGIAGAAPQVTRTITLSMSDAMRFTPAHIEVKQGETVRLRLHNAGRQPHEFVLGTPQALAAHAALMLKFPDMEHDEPYMAHLAPGRSGELLWRFNRAGEFEFACLIAGHYQAGMKGRVSVVPSRR